MFQFFLILILSCSHLAHAQVFLDKIKMPVGFKIRVYAMVPNARSMTWGEHGILFVGSRTEGKLYAITPDKKIHTIAENLDSPNGVAYREGSLYVAEISRILRFSQIEAHLDDHPAPIVIDSKFPSDQHHGWKFIAFGPDGKLYVPIGAPCNVCEIHDPYAAILRMEPDGSKKEIFARGVRNTVGFDWHPVTHELWFTDNGRDMMGDDIPSDELNHAPKAGMHFGFPYCHEGSIPDPEFGKGHECKEFTAPAEKLGAHVASLGMRFYTGQMFPKEYHNQIFIAEHGSWNRSKKSGYRVMLVSLDQKGRVTGEKVFAQGWMENEKYWGRPVDVLPASDGSLMVSDDTAGAIYQISYQR